VDAVFRVTHQGRGRSSTAIRSEVFGGRLGALATFTAGSVVAQPGAGAWRGVSESFTWPTLFSPPAPGPTEFGRRGSADRQRRPWATEQAKLAPPSVNKRDQRRIFPRHPMRRGRPPQTNVGGHPGSIWRHDARRSPEGATRSCAAAREVHRPTELRPQRRGVGGKERWCSPNEVFPSSRRPSATSGESTPRSRGGEGADGGLTSPRR